jgi:hypothetical protein
LNQFQLGAIVRATNRAVSNPFQKTEPICGQKYSIYYSLRNLLNRGVSSVAAALSIPSEQFLKSYLRKQQPTNSIVIYINLTVNDNKSRIIRFDAAMIVCEGCEEAVKTGNLLGYQRLATLSTTGGFVPYESSHSSLRIEQVLTELVEKIWKDLQGTNNVSNE